MLKIGLTGGIASGKSTVSHMLKEKNIPVIDADVASREVVKPGEFAYQAIVDYFGEKVLNRDRSIDRKALGRIVFSNETDRHQLNEIVHPQVRRYMLREISDYEKNGTPTVILDIPLLIESQLTDWVDKVLVVYVPYNIQLARLMERDRITEEEAFSRMDAQIPLEKKCKMADAVIDNSGPITESQAQLDSILKQWKVH